ncbi:MAG TPA: GPI anchored serine-threonine rich family protein [bacterium]
MAAGSPGPYSYPWAAMPDAVGGQYRIKVADADPAYETIVNDESANFSLVAVLNVLQPESGNVVPAESSYVIQWDKGTATGLSQVRLEYSLDGGSSWQDVGPGLVNNSGSYTWNPTPAAISTEGKVRVYDPAHQSATLNEGAGLFEVRGAVTVTAPNAGTESWDVGSPYDITWTAKGDLDAAGQTLKIVYSADGGSTYPTTIATGITASDGSYSWTILQSVPTSNQAKIKIENESLAAVADESDNPFTVKGQIVLSQPDASGIEMVVNDGYSIQWTTFGNIPTVDLYYSTDNGSTYPNLINTGGPISGSAGSLGWTVPDRIGTQLRVKVVDTNNGAVYDASANAFKIKGRIDLTYPDGSEIFEVGDTPRFLWTPTGTLGNVKLEYSSDSGSTWTQITGSTPSGAGFYDWTIPATAVTTNNARVRITTLHADPSLVVSDMSQNDFSVRGKVTVTYPNTGSEVLIVGDQPSIQWQAQGVIANVLIEYSIDNGSTWSTVVASTGAGSGTYSQWTIPDTAITGQALIRVTDANEPAVTDVSDNPFTIRGALAVDAPTASELLVVDTIYSIKWTRKGNFPTVRIEYSTDGGSNYSVVEDSVGTQATAYDASQGAVGFPWKVPDTLTSNARVRIINNADPTNVFAISPVFKIVGSVTLLTPQGTDKWRVGTANNIRWSKTGSFASIRLSYSTDGGSTYNSIVDSYPAGSGDTGYPWTIPNVAGIVSTNVTVRISDVSEPLVVDVSATFSIIPSFTVTSPTANQTVLANRTHTITWDRQGLNATVNLYYSKDGFSGPGIPIVMGTANDGQHDWPVPDQAELATGPVTTQVRVAYPADEAAAFDDSPDFFIRSGFTVVAPNTTSDKWDVGTSQTIRWTATSANVPSARIQYSVDGGSTFPYELAASAGNAGAADVERTWPWPSVPDTITAQFKVKVSDANDAAAFDVSDFNGKIKAYFRVLTPNASGLELVKGDPYNITWTWNGSVTDVLLEYSKDDFGAQTFFLNGGVPLPNNGLHQWTVPDDITTSPIVKIRVRSSLDADANDVSDDPFKIKARFLVTRPDGGENYRIGLSDTIEWTTTGNVPTVQLIAYSTMAVDPGFPYTAASPYVIEAAYANTPNGNTVYTWDPIPDLPSPNVRVRVIDAADTGVYDDSGANFRIMGQFTVADPLFTGNAVAVDSTQTVSWTWGGAIPTALIEYSTDGGTTYQPIQEGEGTVDDGIVDNDGSFDWVIPNGISDACLIRISDPNDSAVFDVSNTFKIHGAFQIGSPLGGERWVTNEQRLITWTWDGTMANTLIEYSTDGGSTYGAISESSGTPDDGIVPNTGSFLWTVPDDRSATARVRISNPLDPAYGRSASPGDFTIDYYIITWQIRDLLTNNNLDQLSVTSTDGWAASGLSSPIVRDHPYGAWEVTWTRVEYGDQTVNFVADSDQTIQVFMETQVVHIWEAVTELAYDPGVDRVSIASTLRRDGSTVPGAVACDIKFYDTGTLIRQFTNNAAPDAQGFYNFTWDPPTGLVGGKVYNVVTTISIATGGVFVTPRTFTITTEKKLQEVQDTVNTKLDIPLSQVSNQIQTQLDAQSDIIQDAIDDFETKTGEQIALLSQEAANIREAGEQLEEQAVQLEAVNKKFAGRLMLPDTVLLGDRDVVLSYRAFEGLVPLITVTTLDQKGSEVVIAQFEPMSPNPERPEVYNYVIPEINSPPFVAGKFVSVVVEAEVFEHPLLEGPPVKNLEAGAFIVESTTLSTLEGLVAGQAGVKGIVGDVFNLMRVLSNSFGAGTNIVELLNGLNTKVDALPREVAKAIESQGSSRQMRATINEVADQLRALAGDNMGYDFSQIVGKALDESASVQDIRKKADAVQGTTEVMQILMERQYGGVDAPVVHVIYQ